ncbi:MAG TPA: LacI family DNA-binding transcriptional regulator [Actinomycetota bacterium]
MDRPRPVSIKDVAREAGVSTTTVSHALNDKGRLPEQTRERVRRVARELGYRPSAIARGLVSGRTGVLGLAVSVPDVVQDTFASIEYFSQVINGATAEATKRGHALVVVPATGDGDAWQRLAVDGAVVVDPVEGDPNPDAIRAQGLLLVTIGNELPSAVTPAWSIDNDITSAVRSMLDHLASAGARRPALLTWDWPDSYTITSIASYEGWCTSKGIEPHVVRVANLPEVDRPVRDLVALVEGTPNAIDAVFALYEPLGAMTLTAAADRGLAVPTDLVVAATGDTGIGRTTMPTLTTLEFRADRLGAEAIGLLIDRLEGSSPEPERRIVETTITVRASTTQEAVAPETP